jgi:hypothetical protein
MTSPAEQRQHWMREALRRPQTLVLLGPAVFLVLVVAAGAVGFVVGRAGGVTRVRVVNHTTQSWRVCGSDCPQNRPFLLSGHEATVTTVDGGEIFLEQHGRETDNCLFPDRVSATVVKVSARQPCVR